MRSRHIVRGLTLACCIAALPLVTRATPGFWQAATQADFLRGEVEQLSIDVHGRLTLGPRVDRVYDAGVPFVWTSLAARDGSVFLGTGNDGRVVRVTRDGKGDTFFDSGEMEVHALAPAPDGGLYVGTSPDGQIYRVDARGNGTPFFDPEDKYIWALAVNRDGVLFAATGDKGVVYRITPDGQGKPFFSTKTTHAVSLAMDPRGDLLVGTGSPGRVFRVDASGKAFLLLDTPYQEIHQLRVDPKGVIHVAAQSGRPPASGDQPEMTTSEPQRTGTPVVSVSTEITAIAVVDTPVSAQSSSTSQPREDRSGPTGAVYRINPDGLWDILWESREDAPYDVLVEPDGALLVATGGKGKIFRLSGEPLHATLVTRVLAQQITMLQSAADRTWVITANPGLVLALSNGRAERGTYESDVKDARMVATWGTLSWRATAPAGSKVEMYTRAGNTRTPDEAWSDWSGPYANADGTTITSPKARYLQWRAVLTGKAQTPVLTSVTAAYLQRNVRPQVGSITVHPPGTVFQKPFSTGEAEIAGYESDTSADRQQSSSGSPSTTTGAPALGRRTYQKGLQTFVWKAEDDNGDDLTYDVLYRREGETSWKLLKGGLLDPITVWDTTSAPDGSYVMKVVASDARSNPTDTALAGELESTSFDIDNTPPAVTMNGVRRDGRPVITFEVRDAQSAVSRVEYSLDAQRWQAAFPRDGILDAREERFELVLDAAAAGRTLVVRATDEMGNVGTGQVQVP